MDFKILWIDDSPDWVESIKGGIEEHLRECGFTPEIIHQEDADRIDQYIFRADIDMIIVDYHLDEKKDKSGEQIIKSIREKGNFLEIIFYSQDGTALLDELSVYTEHVHCAARGEVEDKIKKLIDFSKHKYGDLGYMRGSVIAEAIDIENILERIIILSFGAQGYRFRIRVLDKLGPIYSFYHKYRYVQSLLKASCSALEKKHDRIPDENSRLSVLKKYKNVMKDFDDEVVERRNILAHAQKEWDADGKLHLRSVNKREKDIDVSCEWMMEMRSILVKYRGVLNKILKENLLLESEEVVCLA